MSATWKLPPGSARHKYPSSSWAFEKQASSKAIEWDAAAIPICAPQNLGMHRGPLLAYLIPDPALSIQSIMVTSKILGRRKTVTYLSLVVIFATLAGYLCRLTLVSW